MTKKLAGVAAVAAMAIPAVAATGTAQANPIPQCVQNVPGFVVYAVNYTLENGEPPRIMGPIC